MDEEDIEEELDDEESRQIYLEFSRQSESGDFEMEEFARKCGRAELEVASIYRYWSSREEGDTPIQEEIKIVAQGSDASVNESFKRVTVAKLKELYTKCGFTLPRNVKRDSLAAALLAKLRSVREASGAPTRSLYTLAVTIGGKSIGYAITRPSDAGEDNQALEVIACGSVAVQSETVSGVVNYNVLTDSVGSLVAELEGRVAELEPNKGVRDGASFGTVLVLTTRGEKHGSSIAATAALEASFVTLATERYSEWDTQVAVVDEDKVAKHFYLKKRSAAEGLLATWVRADGDGEPISFGQAAVAEFYGVGNNAGKKTEAADMKRGVSLAILVAKANVDWDRYVRKLSLRSGGLDPAVDPSPEPATTRRRLAVPITAVVGAILILLVAVVALPVSADPAPPPRAVHANAAWMKLGLYVYMDSVSATSSLATELLESTKTLTAVKLEAYFGSIVKVFLAASQIPAISTAINTHYYDMSAPMVVFYYVGFKNGLSTYGKIMNSDGDDISQPFLVYKALSLPEFDDFFYSRLEPSYAILYLGGLYEKWSLEMKPTPSSVLFVVDDLGYLFISTENGTVESVVNETLRQTAQNNVNPVIATAGKMLMHRYGSVTSLPNNTALQTIMIGSEAWLMGTRSVLMPAKWITPL
ncbi:hypothetical protein HK101_002335 [Irineochytrium annulatum]|nr:hypothetical protein HK101_002335 [Irineochytrium annulatum]